MTPTPIDRLEIPRAAYLGRDDAERLRADRWCQSHDIAGFIVTRRYVWPFRVYVFEAWFGEPIPVYTGFRGREEVARELADADPRDWRMVVRDPEYRVAS